MIRELQNLLHKLPSLSEASFREPSTDPGTCLRSSLAADRFKLSETNRVYSTCEISSESLVESIPTCRLPIKAIPLQNDGILQFEAGKYDLAESTVYLQMPGLSNRLGKVVFDLEAKKIVDFEPYCRPGLVKGILLQSTSPIAIDLMRLVDASIAPETNLTPFIQTAEFGENEAIVVDSRGNAVIIGLHRLPDDDESWSTVLGVREGVRTIQSHGLRFCGGVTISHKNFGIGLHAMSPEAMQALLNESFRYVKQLGSGLRDLSVTLCRSSEGVRSAGSTSSFLEYGEIVQAIQGGQRTAITEIDTSCFSLDVSAQVTHGTVTRLRTK